MTSALQSPSPHPPPKAPRGAAPPGAGRTTCKALRGQARPCAVKQGPGEAQAHLQVNADNDAADNGDNDDDPKASGDTIHGRP